MIDANDILGSIIAGGQATRMNKENKALKILAGKPLAEHIAKRLIPQVGRLIINANRDEDALSAIGQTGLSGTIPIIADDSGLGAGPLAGLLKSLQYANSQGFSHLATVAGDTPFYPRNLVASLASGLADLETITIARSEGYPQPIFGLWPTHLSKDLEAWLREGQSNKVMAWVRTHAHRFVDFDAEGRLDPFFNINTPEDLALAESMMESEMN